MNLLGFTVRHTLDLTPSVKKEEKIIKKQSKHEMQRNLHLCIKDKNNNDLTEGDSVRFNTFYLNNDQDLITQEGIIENITFNSENKKFTVKIITKEKVGKKNRHTYNVSSPTNDIELCRPKSPPVDIEYKEGIVPISRKELNCFLEQNTIDSSDDDKDLPFNADHDDDGEDDFNQWFGAIVIGKDDNKEEALTEAEKNFHKSPRYDMGDFNF